MSRLRWSQTQDIIELDVINRDVYEYFVDNLNSKGLNQYIISNLGYASLSQDLQQRFEKIQSFVKAKLHLTMLDNSLDPSDQDCLNSLHSNWVKLHQQYPNIAKLADFVFPGDIAAINKLIHAIEDSTTDFEAETQSPNHKMINHFGTDVLGFGTYNISIAYNNLGRSTWQKWQHNDTTVDTDLNNFEDLYTTLIFKIIPTEVRSAPKEYEEWCNKHNLPCVGGQMPLANFDKLNDNLLQYRQMFYKNSVIENNFIILE